MIYVEEFLYRGRDPVHEAGKAATYHAILCEWQKGPDGSFKPLYSAAMTPTQLEAAGFPLATILDGITAQALRDKDAAEAEAALSREGMTVAQTERAAAVDERNAIEQIAAAAVQQAAARVAQEKAARQTAEAERAQVAAALAQKTAAHDAAVAERDAAKAERDQAVADLAAATAPQESDGK